MFVYAELSLRRRVFEAHCEIKFKLVMKIKLREVINLLEKFCVSDAAYHELFVVCDELPRNYLILQERAYLDNNAV